MLFPFLERCIAIRHAITFFAMNTADLAQDLGNLTFTLKNVIKDKSQVAKQIQGARRNHQLSEEELAALEKLATQLDTDQKSY